MVDETRTTHVWRQRSEDDEDVWLDIQRVDDLISSKGQAEGYQKTTYHLKWEDETVPLEHPTRDVEMLDVANPQDDEQIVPVPVIKKYRTHNFDQKITHSFLNGEEIETRTYSVRRVYHRDTVTEPPVDGADYEVLSETIDESQYIDVALVETVVTTSGQRETFQETTYRYNTEPIEQWSVPAPEDHDASKVVHLDPMQNIVNVQWGPSVEFVTILSTVVLIWEPTSEYVVDGGGICSPSLGYTDLDSNSTYLIHFEVSDLGSPPDHLNGEYKNGEFGTAGTGEITGLSWPFPVSVDLGPWEFVGEHAGFPNVPVLRLDWEENESGEVIVDRDGNPVEAFSGAPFRRGDTASFAVRGQAFTSGPQCWQHFGGPGGDVPTIGAFVEDVAGTNYTSAVPGSEQELSISSITVEYGGKTFQGCGYYASGGDLQIICEKVT